MKDLTIESADNMAVWNRFAQVPKEFQKTIGGGRLKGFTDINPMWRLQCLTEQYGPAGSGFYYDVIEHWIDHFEGESVVNVIIKLYVKENDHWSAPITGIGGSMILSKEKNGPFVNDEAMKGALTDALSVACKALGVGADVYMGRSDSKYSRTPSATASPAPEPRNLDAPIAALRAAKSVEELRETWHKVNLDFTGDHVSLGVLTSVKDKQKSVLSVANIFDGEVQK